MLARTIDVLDDGRLADNALKRMQNRETTACGEKRSPRFCGHVEGDQAVRISGNPRFILEFLARFALVHRARKVTVNSLPPCRQLKSLMAGL